MADYTSILISILTINNVLAAVQILTLFAIIIYVIKTWEMASATKKYAETSNETLREMRTTREEEYAPYVVVYFDLKDYDIDLVIKNMGKGFAKDFKVKFETDLQGSSIKTEIGFLKNGISYIPPEYEIRTAIDRYNMYLSAKLPLHYTAKIQYSARSIRRGNKRERCT
jgi:hypothetical protein